MTTKSIIVETGDGQLVLPTYATVGWAAQDVHKHRSDAGLSAWTDAEAEQFLTSIEYDIEDAMIERGWEVIAAACSEDEEGYRR